jgi:hypothetical protein
MLKAESTGEGVKMIHLDSVNMLNRAEPQVGLVAPPQGNWQMHVAKSRFRQARCGATLGSLWSALTGRERRLMRLSEVQSRCRVRGSHYAGVRTVSIDEIQGSEGRCADFDTRFRPLRSHNKGRWASVAKARLKGVTLPLVELVQVGDVYFVRDGHHRISVARAFGQESIDAEVTVWQVTGWLQEERPAAVGRLVAVPV